MSDPEYAEEWVIKVDDKQFVTSKQGKDMVLEAMRQAKRFVPLSENDIISVRHISYIYRSSKTIKNQIGAGDPHDNLLSSEETRKRIAEIRSKI